MTPDGINQHIKNVKLVLLYLPIFNSNSAEETKPINLPY